jgi:hypothetical protein
LRDKWLRYMVVRYSKSWFNVSEKRSNLVQHIKW